MGGINVGRWLAGGVIAGLVIFVIEGIGSLIYMNDMQAALSAHNLRMEFSGSVWVISILISLLAGLTLVFFYAAVRPRFGPGPRTAIIVAVVLWVAAYLVTLLGYHLLGLFPGGMLVLWGAIGLIEMIIASLVGGWTYKEERAPAA